MNDDWQWCSDCYGFTLHTNGSCTQCGDSLHTFENNEPGYTYITVTDEKTLQIKAEYEISLN